MNAGILAAWLCLLLAAGAQETNPSRDLLHEALDEASAGRDSRDYVLKFIQRVEDDPMIDFQARPESILPVMKEKLQTAPTNPDSIFSDPEYLARYQKFTRSILRVKSPGLGTRDVSKIEFRPCVAVGSSSQGYFGTGTVIAPRLVLTAGHVVDEGPEFIFVGLKTSGPGKVVEVSNYINLGYMGGTTTRNDIALLELAEDCGVEPAIIAPLRAADYMESVRVVGFGFSGTSQRVETKRLTDILVFSRACDRDVDFRFGGNRGLEFIAADPHGRDDTCRGDSGGPAFTMFDSRWMLVGVTSRATNPEGVCGDGGIYTRVGNYLDRIVTEATLLHQELRIFP